MLILFKLPLDFHGFIISSYSSNFHVHHWHTLNIRNKNLTQKREWHENMILGQTNFAAIKLAQHFCNSKKRVRKGQCIVYRSKTSLSQNLFQIFKQLSPNYAEREKESITKPIHILLIHTSYFSDKTNKSSECFTIHNSEN